MKKSKLFCKGKTKELYEIEEDDKILIQEFKDDVTAGNGKKHEVMERKGYFCNQISSKIFEKLEEDHIPTHYISRYDDESMLIRKTKPIPLEVVIRKYPAGSLIKRLGLDRPGKPLNQGGSGWVTIQEFQNKFKEGVITELYYKNDDLGDPLINDDHACAYITDSKSLNDIKCYARLAFNSVEEFFKRIGLTLMDVKFEFGVDSKNKIILIDDVSPEGCRLKDYIIVKRFDKDAFRSGKGNFLEELAEVHTRILNIYVLGNKMPDNYHWMYGTT